VQALVPPREAAAVAAAMSALVPPREAAAANPPPRLPAASAAVSALLPRQLMTLRHARGAFPAGPRVCPQILVTIPLHPVTRCVRAAGYCDAAPSCFVIRNQYGAHCAEGIHEHAAELVADRRRQYGCVLLHERCCGGPILHAGPSLSRTAAERRLPGRLRCRRFRPDVEWPTFAQCLERPPIFAGFGIFPDLLGLMCH
jgi:hypothetical protein